jgi:hypothetical protein
LGLSLFLQTNGIPVTEISRVDHDLWRRTISHDPRVKQNTYAVSMAFAMFGDYRDGTDVFPSMATIAEMVGLSSATKVHPHRKKLVEYGYLTDTGARSSADTVVYRLTAPAEAIYRSSKWSQPSFGQTAGCPPSRKR